MRRAVIAVVGLGVIFAMTASAERPAKKRVAKPVAKGFWKVLVKPNQKWVLHDSALADHAKDTITIETYDVRKVGNAEVARLRWTYAHDGVTEDISGQRGKLDQIAVTADGMYLLDRKQDDAAIAKVVKGKPHRSDPPKAYAGTKQNEGRYVSVEDGVVCLGQGPMPDAGPCEDTCDGRLCLTADDGIVELSGNWAPDNSIYER